MASLYWYRADVRAHTDSLLTSLRLVQNRLTPLQDHLVNHMQAVRAEDWVGSYRAMRAASEVAPHQYLYTFAGKANQANRPRETADALMRLDSDSVYQRSIQGYWRLLTFSLHQLGQHHTELANARRARDIDRHSASALVQELKAFSGLGRLPEVRSGLDTLFSLPRDGWLTPGYAAAWVALDLRAHGHRLDAATTMQRALAWYRSRPAIERAGQEWREWFAELLYFAEDWAAADTAYRSLMSQFPTSAGYPDNATYLGHIGAIAVRRGDLVTAKADVRQTHRDGSLPIASGSGVEAVPRANRRTDWRSSGGNAAPAGGVRAIGHDGAPRRHRLRRHARLLAIPGVRATKGLRREDSAQ